MRKQFILSETYMKHVNTSFNRRVMSQTQYIFLDINARKYPQTKSKKNIYFRDHFRSHGIKMSG